MPTPLPDNWPAPSPSQTLPGVYVMLPDLGMMAVGSWSLERELQGALLPGNVRAASGISIGSGSVTVRGIESDGSIRTPWSPNARVKAGGDASWFASYDGPALDASVPLGQWQISPQSGSVASPASRTIDLVEKQYAGTSALNKISGDGFQDGEPVFLVDQLARQIGYYSTPKPSPTCVLSIPLAGGFATEVGTLKTALNNFADPDSVTSWSSENGRIKMHGGQVMIASATSALLNPSGECYITLDTTSEVDFIFGDALDGDTSMLPTVGVDPSSGRILSRAVESATISTGSFVPNADPAQPHRVQLHVKRIGSPGAWTGVEVRARSAYAATWSGWVASSAVSTVDTADLLTISITTSAIASAIMVTTTDDSSTWDLGNAVLETLGGALETPWIDGTLDAWTALQQVVAAWCAAAWPTTDGVLLVRNRDSMAGVGQAVRVVDVGTVVEDIPWSIDPADTADRLEVSYQPVDKAIQTEAPSTFGPIAWSSEDAVALPPNQTTVVTANVDAYFEALGDVFDDGSSTWTPAWNDSTTNPNWLSVYGASSSRDGTGAHAPDGTISIKTVQVSSGRFELHITNPTTTTYYTVDATGNPCLFLASAGAYRQNTASVVVRGLDSDQAINPLQIDLGRYVQNAADAEALADYIWGRVSTPMWKASSVRVALDWSYDIGDVVQLTHSRSGLNVRAAITKVAYDGAPGQVTQTLDLVLLPPTWADFDAAWAGKTWADFDSFWAESVWPDFDYDPTRSP